MTLAHQFLKAVPLFEKCDENTLQRLALGLRWTTYKKGDTILFQGMIVNQMFLLASGRVAVFSRKDGETRQVATLGEGQYFGEISLLTNKAATATIKADVDETQVYVMEREAVLAALATHPDVKADVIRKVEERNQNRLDAFNEVGAGTPA